jgi:hypothetical protein
MASHSEIFADLYKVPQPLAVTAPKQDGRPSPIVLLPNRQGDFVDLLGILYDPFYAFNINASSFAKRVIEHSSCAQRNNLAPFLQRPLPKSSSAINRT